MAEYIGREAAVTICDETVCTHRAIDAMWAATIFAATASRGRGRMLTITIKANVPAADAQGLKERIAMDIERYGDCKVVSITSDRKYEQIGMKGERKLT